MALGVSRDMGISLLVASSIASATFFLRRLWRRSEIPTFRKPKKTLFDNIDCSALTVEDMDVIGMSVMLDYPGLMFDQTDPWLKAKTGISEPNMNYQH